ncbi:uncharacterized protein LOC100123552 isoform X2 [Nasonia vitripennis]|uniref:Potassium channel domain-containing protein n=2 Tax=Nasonia vitripennis TaxID=7425 RepID=A0A7M7QHX9_NASVI|nr:uncharacterized protein LOC100123552 isoform X2 [Nasonia vitripennis]
MEDSYTVHRRRKAAARRREKTPEPTRADAAVEGLDEDEVDGKAESLETKEDLPTEEPPTPATAVAEVTPATTPKSEMDEEEERRARMERMVEDTERMEMMAEEEQQRPRSRPRQLEAEEQPKQARARSPAVNRPEAEDSTRARAAASPPRKPDTSEEIPPTKTSRRPRESSEGTELRRRMGSPEAAKTRAARHLSPSTTVPEEEQQELQRTSSKKRVSSRQRHQNPSDEEEPPPPPPPTAHRSRRSPSQPVKKQIIPLSDDSLIEDVARAKRAYAHREPSDDYEYEDEEEDEDEEYIRPRRKRETTVRKRKTSVMHTDQEKEEIRKNVNQTSSWWSWIPFFGRRQKVEEMIEESGKEKKKKGKEKVDDEPPPKASKSKLEKTASTTAEPEKATIRDFFRSISDINGEFNEFCRQNPREVQILCELRNLCIVETVLTIIVCGLGAFAFRFTEGAFEQFYKCGVKRVKRDFLDSLWNFSHNMKEDDWKSMARRKLMDFEEQLHAAHEAGVQTYSGQKSWTFLNSMVYCLTVITTIGYGHISPSTTTGRALTIVYAIFGIPMFLIVLADFGKLFTRGIKFLWAFVRRLYYTGSCRKVRRTVQMQEMMKGVQMVYDLATFRRPSQMTPEELQEIQRQQQTVLSLDGNTQVQQQPESPSTPAMSTFEIDDEFNLPISVAITILVVYIFIGATVFNIFEDWTFFESFYFVFISMSTIGFGDFVPMEPLYMMLSIVYLIFGLALTSMCINVVQVMLADQFKHASQKIGATIGFHVSEEDGSLKPGPPEPVEIAEVHGAVEDTKEKVAPKAKQEDVDL